MGPFRDGWTMAEVESVIARGGRATAELPGG